MTYRQFNNLYYWYQQDYDFKLSKKSYREIDEEILKDEQWF